MFDLKFFKYLHTFLVNLWMYQFNTNFCNQKGRPDIKWLLTEVQEKQVSRTFMWEFIKTYPDYVYWLGIYFNKKMDDYHYTMIYDKIILFEYDW